PYVHLGARQNLLGKEPDNQLVESLSTDRRVTPQTPPTFLFHTDSDSVGLPEHCILFYLALKKAKGPAELHIYEKGRHGLGLGSSDPVLSSWKERLADWLKARGLTNAKPAP